MKCTPFPPQPQLREQRGTPKAEMTAFVKGTGLLVSLSELGEVAVWDLATGRRKRTWTVGTGMTTAISRDGDLLAVGSLSSGNIHVFKSTTGEKVSEISYNPPSATDTRMDLVPADVKGECK